MPGYCDKHKSAIRKQDDANRGTAAERGYDSKWTKARVYYLRSHPLCVHCKRDGRVTAAQVVDHIVPHKLKDARDSKDATRIAAASALFWDSSNWQSLCKSHHDSKTATEDGGFGRMMKPNTTSSR